MFTLCVVHQRLSTTRPAVSCVGSSAPSKYCVSKKKEDFFMSVKLSFLLINWAPRHQVVIVIPRPVQMHQLEPLLPFDPTPHPSQKKCWGWEVLTELQVSTCRVAKFKVSNLVFYAQPTSAVISSWGLNLKEPKETSTVLEPETDKGECLTFLFHVAQAGGNSCTQTHGLKYTIR